MTLSNRIGARKLLGDDQAGLGGQLAVGRASAPKPTQALAGEPDVSATPHIGNLTPAAVEHQALDAAWQIGNWRRAGCLRVRWMQSMRRGCGGDSNTQDHPNPADRRARLRLMRQPISSRSRPYAALHSRDSTGQN